MKVTVTGYHYQCVICGETKEVDQFFVGPIAVIKHIRASHQQMNGEAYGLKEAKDVYDAGRVVEKAARSHQRFIVEQKLARVRMQLNNLECELEHLKDCEEFKGQEFGGAVARPFENVER